MRLFLAFLLLLSSITIAQGATKCTDSPMSLFEEAVEGATGRIASIVKQVAARAKLKSIPKLCTTEKYDEPIPYLIPMSFFGGRGYILLVPKAVEEFTDEELLGVMAHELGHAVLFSRWGTPIVLSPKQYMKRESDADVLGASWVGADTVIKALKAVARGMVRRAQKIQERDDPNSSYLVGQTYWFMRNQIDPRIEAINAFKNKKSTKHVARAK